MPNIRRRNTRMRNTRRRNTRRRNTRRRNTRTRNTRRRNTRRSNNRRNKNKRGNKRGKGDVPIDMLVEDLGDFDDIDDAMDRWVAEKKLAWMRITREVMEENGITQGLAGDIAEMVAQRIS